MSSPHLKCDAFPTLHLAGPSDTNPPKRRKSEYLQNKERAELLEKIPPSVTDCRKSIPVITRKQSQGSGDENAQKL